MTELWAGMALGVTGLLVWSVRDEIRSVAAQCRHHVRHLIHRRSTKPTPSTETREHR